MKKNTCRLFIFLVLGSFSLAGQEALDSMITSISADTINALPVDTSLVPIIPNNDSLNGNQNPETTSSSIVSDTVFANMATDVKDTLTSAEKDSLNGTVGDFSSTIIQDSTSSIITDAKDTIPEASISNTKDSLNNVAGDTSSIIADSVKDFIKKFKVNSSNVSALDSVYPIATVVPTAQRIDPLTGAISYSDTVVLSFIKYKVTQSPDSGLFNILKIVNYKDKTVEGNLETTFPEGWNVIGVPSGKVKIAPGDSFFIAFRVSIPRNAKGGQAYVIASSLSAKGEKYSAASYIEIPAKNKWNMSVDLNTIYFSEMYESMSFRVFLSNKGNTNELIKLNFEIGKLLNVVGFGQGNSSVYIDVPANTDTVITYHAKYANLSEDDLYLYENRSKESTITITGSTPLQTKKESIWFKKLKSSHTLIKDQNATPLNFSLQFFNLLAPTVPSVIARAWGLVLLPKKREISYLLSMNSIYFKSELYKNYFNTPQNLTFFVKYATPKYDILLGDGSIGGGIIGVYGRGVITNYYINKDHAVKLGAVRKIGIDGNAFSLDFNNKIGNKIRVISGAMIDNEHATFYDRTSLIGHIGTGYSFLKHHSVSGAIYVGNVKYTNNTDPRINFTDTSLTGFAYRLGYNVNYEKLKINLQTTNNRNGYVGNRGTSATQGNASYQLSKKSRIRFSYVGNNSKLTTLPQGLFLPKSFSYTNWFRLGYGSSIRNFNYEAGVMYNSAESSQYDPGSAFTTVASSELKAVYGFTRYKISAFKTISSNITAGYANSTRIDRRNQGTSPPEDNVLTTRLGFNYRERYWSINITYNKTPYYYYRGGSEYELVHAQSIDFRPKFEKFYFNRKMLLTLYGNYSIRMPSNIETINITSRVEFFLKYGWRANLGLNVYKTSQLEDDGQKRVFRNMNLFGGISKSFDLPQPRLKYYNLKVVCYHDMNGNKLREENEPLLSDILVRIEKDLSLAEEELGSFTEVELVTDLEGEINYYNLPQGSYKLNFTPLANLKDLINGNGKEQSVFINSNLTHYVPYVQSYRAKGKIIINRDELSSETNIALKGVRITATGTDGSVYSVLTDEYGVYSLDIPNSGQYKIKVNNVFGEKFLIENDEHIVDFNGLKVFELNFVFNEKKRKVNFKNAEGYQFNLNRETDNEAEADAEEDTKDVWGDEVLADFEVPKTGLYFKVQIGVYKNPVKLSLFGSIRPIITETTPNGKRYSAGLFTNMKSANEGLKFLIDNGFKDAFIKAYYNGEEIPLSEAAQYDK